MIQASQPSTPDSVLLATLRGYAVTAVHIADAWHIYRSEDAALTEQSFASFEAAKDAYWGDEFWALTFMPFAVEIERAA